MLIHYVSRRITAAWSNIHYTPGHPYSYFIVSHAEHANLIREGLLFFEIHDKAGQTFHTARRPKVVYINQLKTDIVLLLWQLERHLLAFEC